VSLLALALVGAHTVASVVHTSVDIRWVDAVVPFAGPYRPVWIGLGALALDLLLVPAVAAALRHRLGSRSWQVVHGGAYRAWGLAAVHTVGIGTDVDRTWAWAVRGEPGAGRGGGVPALYRTYKSGGPWGGGSGRAPGTARAVAGQESCAGTRTTDPAR
jgi:hypothetical protein